MGNATASMPLQVNVSYVLSQDVVTTATIPVDVTSATPVGVFTNPASGLVEALIVATLENSPSQAAHVARDPETDGGWRLATPFAGQHASEVAVGTAYPGSSSAAVVGFFVGDGGTLYTSTLAADGTTWSAPLALTSPAVSNLRVALSPAGRLVLYARSADGNLVTAYQDQVGGPFSAHTCSFGHGLQTGDFQLVVTSDTSWTLTANVDGQPRLASGTLGAGEPASVAALPSYDGTLKQVVVGHFSVEQQTTVFALVDEDDSLHMWSASADTAVAQPAAGLKVTSAAGHVAANDGTLHLYAVDDQLGLWAYHQSAGMPWNDDGTPNWARAIPIDSGISGVASSGSPADAPSLFALDAADGTLRLHVQDPATQMWRAGPVRQPHDEAFEVARYRTEISLMDANGVPVPNHPATLAVSASGSACELSCAGSTVTATQAPTVLTTDALGRATLAILPTAGLSVPDLVFAADGLPEPVPVRPVDGVLGYLAGEGTLNPTNPDGPLQRFDAEGQTLAAATVPGEPAGTPLAPAAKQDPDLAAAIAAGIQHTAQAGLGTLPSGVAGFRLQLDREKPPAFSLLQTADDLAAARTALAAPAAGLGSIWTDIEHFFGDLWAGISRGLIVISDVFVDAAHKFAQFTISIGEEIAHGVSLAIAGVEQAAHFVAGCFAAVKAAVDRVIDWLKALFDFEAIWRTKMALEQVMTQLPASVKPILRHWETVEDCWFAKQEAQLDDKFAKAIASVEGKQFSGLQGFQAPGKPDSKPVAGGASPADFNHNVHHNWLHDKVAASAPADPKLRTHSAAQGPWDDLADHVSSAGKDFEDALKSLADALKTLIEHPSEFATRGVADLLKTAQGILDSAIQLADASADLFIDLGLAAMDGMTKVMTAELHLGPLNRLWKWIAKAAGYPDDDKLTLAALAALLGAFPTTVVYKLIHGVHTEPFPEGQFAPRANAALARQLAAMPEGALLAAALLQTFYAVPAMISDLLGDAAAWWLTVITALWSGAIWGLQHGLPNLEMALIGGGVTAAVLALVIAIVPAATLLSLGQKAWAAKGDISAVVWTIVGIASLIYAIYEAVEGEIHAAAIAAAFLLPWPNWFSFLNLKVIRDNPAVGEFAIDGKCAVDMIGYFGGGIALIIDAEKT